MHYSLQLPQVEPVPSSFCIPLQGDRAPEEGAREPQHGRLSAVEQQTTAALQPQSQGNAVPISAAPEKGGDDGEATQGDAVAVPAARAHLRGISWVNAGNVQDTAGGSLNTLAEKAVQPREKPEPAPSAGLQTPVLHKCKLPVPAHRCLVQA